MATLSFTPPDGPRGVLKPGDAGTSLLGVFGEAPVAAVDRAGAVQLLSSDWTLDWWIAAEDKLHTPSTAPNVRQARLGAGPVIQTSVRVPGGDIVQRVWATRLASGIAVTVEFENTTVTPVGLTLAIRPFDLSGQKSDPSVRIGSDHIGVADTSIWLSSEIRDTVPELDAGVVPLPHKATTRVLITPPDFAGNPDRAVPTASEARKGWDALIAATGSVDLPDDRMTALFDQVKGRLSLGTHDLADRLAGLHPTAGLELTALCLAGFRNEAVDTLRVLLADRWHPPRQKRGHPRAAAADAVEGLGWALAMYAPGWAEEFLPAATALATAVDKGGTDAEIERTHAGLARISTAVGDRTAATALHSGLGLGASGRLATLTDLATHLEAASETGSWGDDEVEPAAIALGSLRGLLIREAWDGEQPVIDLFPSFPAAWRGGSVELHGIDTVFGAVSTAIRWHGYRPALLWEFERADHCMTPVRLMCSSLDPNWNSTDRKGETLLTGVSEELPDAPAEGESFS